MYKIQNQKNPRHVPQASLTYPGDESRGLSKPPSRHSATKSVNSSTDKLSHWKRGPV